MLSGSVVEKISALSMFGGRPGPFGLTRLADFIDLHRSTVRPRRNGHIQAAEEAHKLGHSCSGQERPADSENDWQRTTGTRPPLSHRMFPLILAAAPFQFVRRFPLAAIR